MKKHYLEYGELFLNYLRTHFDMQSTNTAMICYLSAFTDEKIKIEDAFRKDRKVDIRRAAKRMDIEFADLEAGCDELTYEF